MSAEQQIETTVNDQPDAPTGAPPQESAQAQQTSTEQPQKTAIAQSQEIPFHESIPEKFRVFEGEGDQAQFNLEQSAKKLLDSYTALERRGGAPESIDDYDIDGSAINEQFNFEEFKKDETNQSFLKKMHAAGLNNSQVQQVLEYGMKELIPGLMTGDQALTTDEAVQHMQNEVWQDKSEYNRNMLSANKAYTTLPGALQEKVDSKIGNDPVFLEVMAIFGSEMGEDRPPAELTGMGDSVEIEKLMLSDAYKNPKNPEHEKASKQVREFFKKKHPEQS